MSFTPALSSAKGKSKSERHHWWPECVSEYWKDDTGCVHWLSPDGSIRRAPPKNFGVIGNAHHIKLGRPGKATVWDQNFEPIFDRADSNFPCVIQWLSGLNREPRSNIQLLANRFLAHDTTDDLISLLVECIVSLAIRSPMNREAAVQLAEHFRGPLLERERNMLIALNMRDSHRNAISAIGTRGKFAILYSPEQEFIFGDGFYHNLRSPVHNLMQPKMLVPLTPIISVLYARPASFSTEPRLSTLVLNTEEAIKLNEAVQIYSRQALFFRSQKPIITEEYSCDTHLQFSDQGNIIDELIRMLPGVNISMHA